MDDEIRARHRVLPFTGLRDVPGNHVQRLLRAEIHTARLRTQLAVASAQRTPYEAERSRDEHAAVPFKAVRIGLIGCHHEVVRRGGLIGSQSLERRATSRVKPAAGRVCTSYTLVVHTGATCAFRMRGRQTHIKEPQEMPNLTAPLSTQGLILTT